MRRFKFWVVIVLVTLCNCDFLKETVLSYPNTKRGEQIDDYFGTQVADPYRWLEDDNSEETTEWVKAQNAVTFTYLEKIPFREKIKKRLTELWDYEKYSQPFKGGDKYFYYKNDGLQNQYVVYIQDNPDAEAELFLDPNTFSEDGTVALSGLYISKNGQYAAYMISKSGSDWREINVMEVESRKKLDDQINWVKFSSISWYKDGFYYSCYDTPKEGEELQSINEFQKVYYHKIGTDASQDKLIYESKEQPDWGFGTEVTEDERFLLLYTWESTSGNQLHIKDLNNPNSTFLPIVENFDNDHNFIGNQGETLYLETNLDALNKRLITVNIDKLTPENWQDIIPEGPHVLSTSMGRNKIFANYLVDVKSLVIQFDMNGNKEKEIELPGIGTAYGFRGEKIDEDLFYTFTSFTSPGAIYRYNTKSGTSKLFRRSKVKFKPEDYVTEQVFYESKDDRIIPMFIVYKKNLKKNGKNLTYLYGYGGFNINLRPSFSVATIVWLENGGVYA